MPRKQKDIWEFIREELQAIQMDILEVRAFSSSTEERVTIFYPPSENLDCNVEFREKDFTSTLSLPPSMGLAAFNIQRDEKIVDGEVVERLRVDFASSGHLEDAIKRLAGEFARQHAKRALLLAKASNLDQIAFRTSDEITRCKSRLRSLKEFQ